VVAARHEARGPGRARIVAPPPEGAWRAPRVACPRVARRGALRQPTEPEPGRATPDALPL